MNNADQIKQLYAAYKNRSITSNELDQLLSLIKSDTISEKLLVKMIEQDLEDEKIIEDPIIQNIIQNAEGNIILRTQPIPVRRLRRKSIAAASIVAIVCGSLLYFNYSKNNNDTLVSNNTQLEDVLPGGNKAILKLSDGRNYTFDEKSSQIRVDDNSIVLNEAEKLVELSDEPITLELFTPRKGNYKAVLPDGTKVWLNAESKIIYPSKFTDKNRTIKVEGEIYLEVAKVEDSKFIVELSNNRKIEVLGTQFNVNAYPNHSYIKTSLREGKIQLTNHHGKSAILAPGYKAIMSNNVNNISISTTIINNDLAWLRNKFNFEDLTFEEIMQKIARWYDVKIFYKSTVPNIEFYGELNKDNSLSYIVDVFKQSGVKMKIKNQTLIIE